MKAVTLDNLKKALVRVKKELPVTGGSSGGGTSLPSSMRFYYNKSDNENFTCSFAVNIEYVSRERLRITVDEISNKTASGIGLVIPVEIGNPGDLSAGTISDIYSQVYTNGVIKKDTGGVGFNSELTTLTVQGREADVLTCMLDNFSTLEKLSFTMEAV